MDVLVCFKVVPDLDMLSAEEWLPDENFNIDTSFVKKDFNCFDESALEMSLKLKDSAETFQNALDVNLTALTIDDSSADTYLKSLYALNFEKCVRIEPDNEDLKFFPEKVAAVIAQYALKINKQDIIILGRQKSEADNAKTPLLAAEMLKWPCITNVTKIEAVSNNVLKVTNLADGGFLTQIIEPPCVLSVGNAPDTYLRVPTLKAKIKSSKKMIDTFELKNFDYIKCSPNKPQSLEKIDNSRRTVILKGSTVSEKVRILYEDYLQKRLMV